MTNPVDPALASSLSAPASEVPAQQRQSEAPSNPSQPQPQQQQTQPSKESGKPKKEKKEAKPKDTKDTKDATPATDGPEKLTGAELKKRAKAEKAARRAKEKSDREAGGAPAPAGGSAAGAGGAGQPATPKKGQPAGGAGAGGDKGRGLPRRPSGQASGQPSAAEQKKKAEEKNVAVFGHLYGQQRRATVAGAGKEVHPAVLALGLQMRDYVVCGSSARCVATLLAFKRVRCYYLNLDCVGANGPR